MYNTSISLAQTTLPSSSTELSFSITELPARMELWIDYTKFTMEIAYTLYVGHTQQSVVKSANGYKRFSDVWPLLATTCI